MTRKHAIIYSLAALGILAIPLQAVIDPSLDNIACACLALASSLFTLMYLNFTDALQTQPLSTFSIFGFCVTTQLGALLLQTVAWTSLSASLYNGVYTFATLALYQTIAIGVHAVYRYFYRPRPDSMHLVRGFLSWLGVYLTPSCGALWLIGLVGLASYSVYVSEPIYESTVGKFGQAFNFLAWAPFLIPFYLHDTGNDYCKWQLQRWLLVLYEVSLVALGLALNTRGVMFFGVATVGLLYLLSAMRSDVPVDSRSILRVAGLVCVALILVRPVSNLTTAMVIARGLGLNAPVAVKIERTFEVWRNPALIEAYRAHQAELQLRSAYDEHYVENPILARFVMTKFHDNALHFANGIRTEDGHRRLQDVSIELFWAILPQPVLDLLDINVDKAELDFSVGDLLPYLSKGSKLGTHRVGSMFAQGIALFGPLFPFVFAALCLCFFALMNLLTIRRENALAAVSALGMLQIWIYFYSGISYEGLNKAFLFIVRNFEQTIIIYCVVFGMVRLFLRLKTASFAIPPAPERHSGSRV